MQQHIHIISLLLIGSFYAVHEVISQESSYLYQPEEEEDDLPRVAVPINYNLYLQPIVSEGKFQGQVEITIGVLEMTDIIILHAHRDLDVLFGETVIHSVGQWMDPDSNSSDVYQREKISYSTEHHMIKISKMRRYLFRDWCEIIFDEELKKGVIYVLKLKFLGNLTTGEIGPFYHITYNDVQTEEDRWYVATDLQSQHAHRVFPCFDELNLKATFQLSVYRPGDFKALSSTVCEFTEEIEDSEWVIDHFNTTPPMAPESLALIIFNPYSLQPVNPVKMWRSAIVHGYAQDHLIDNFQSDLMYQIIRMLQVIEHYIEMSFPLPDLYIMVLPKYHRNTVNGYWGLLMVSEEELQNGLVNYQVMQIIAKQWVGHLVTPNSRSRMGFNNGLAYYLAHTGLLAIEKHPKYENMINWGPAFSRQVYYTYSEINGRDSQHFKAIRTARLCQMLNFTLTESTFKAAFHNFLEDRVFQIYDEDYFFKLLDQQAWADSTLPSSTSTLEISKSWLKKDHFPVVTVTRNYVNHTATIEQHAFIREWPYQTSDTMDSLWWIPVLYLSHHNLDLNYILILTWLREERQITIGNLPDQETFVIINPQDIGMFLVNYDHTNWELISQYLDKSPLIEGKALIPVETRSKLLSDVIYLALSGELDFPTALDMTLFVRHEKELSVWSTMLNLYDVIYRELSYGAYDTAVLDKFGAYVAYLLTPAYESLQQDGLETKGRQRIYNELQAFLSHVGYKPALENSRSQLNTDMIFNNSFSERMELRVALRQVCSTFRWYSDEWDLGLESLLNSTDIGHQRLLISLLVSCTRDPEKLNRIFSIILLDDNQRLHDDDDDGDDDNDDVKNVLSSVTDSFTFIRFILSNWDRIKEKWESNKNLWNSILRTATQNFKTRYGFSLVSELYQTHKADLGSARRIVENSLYSVSEKMNGQYKFVRHLASWLDQHLLLLRSQDIPSSQFMSANIVY